MCQLFLRVKWIGKGLIVSHKIMHASVLVQSLQRIVNKKERMNHSLQKKIYILFR